MQWLSLLAAVAASIIGQGLLKAGAAAENFQAQLLDPRTIGGLFLYGLSAMFYIAALRRIPLSVALPCTALSYIFVALIGHFAFHEPLGPQRLFALAPHRRRSSHPRRLLTAPTAAKLRIAPPVSTFTVFGKQPHRVPAQAPLDRPVVSPSATPRRSSPAPPDPCQSPQANASPALNRPLFTSRVQIPTSFRGKDRRRRRLLRWRPPRLLLADQQLRALRKLQLDPRPPTRRQ